MPDKMGPECNKNRHDDLHGKTYKHKPDGCWSWVVLAASFVSLTFLTGYCNTWGVLLPDVMEYFNDSRANTALVGALMNGAAFCLSPLASISCAHFGCRLNAILGAMLIAAGFALSSMVPSLYLMFVTYSAISGIGVCFLYMACTLVVIQYFVKRRALAVGIVTSSACSGVLLISKVNSVFLETFGLINTFRTMAISMGIPFLCASLFDPSVAPSEKGNPQCLPDKTVKKTKYFDWSILGNKLFLIYTISFSIAYMTFFVLPVHAVKYADELNISRNDVIPLYTYLAVSQFLSRNLFCYFAKRCSVSKLYIYQAAAFAYGTVLFFVRFATTANHLLIIFIIVGLVDGGFYGICPLLVTHCVGEDQIPAAWGIFLMITNAFSAMGPFFAGLMADKLGSYVPAFYTSGAVTLIGASLIFLTECSCVKQSTKDNKQTILTGRELIVVERETVL